MDSVTTDECWETGAMIQARTGILYWVIGPEGFDSQNFGLAGGILDGGLFVRGGVGDVGWMSAESVDASVLVASSSVACMPPNMEMTG